MELRDIRCISDLYYVYSYWFTIAMYFISFATLPLALNVWDSPVSFIMCAGLALVGTAAQYRDKFEGKIHYIGALAAALGSMLWTLHVAPECIVLILLACVGIVDEERWLLWAEVACFVMFYVTLIVG